jgi:RNA polymerase sigma factor (sigma-70 family)
VERLDREARERAARTALEQLTERDREVLLLWDAGLSYTEIAAQAGLAVGAVGTTLARARRRLVEAHAGLEARHAARN